MSRKIRYTLFWTFAAIFVIATFFISVYAAGYRLTISWPLNFNKIFEKTGTLVLSSNPKGAKIYINGRNNQGLLKKYFSNSTENYTTPTKINHLLPGEYTVYFEYPGYWSYEKKINIIPSEVTYLEDIELFKQDLPIKIIDAETQNIGMTPDKNYLILEKDRKIIDLKTEKEVQISLTPETTNKDDLKINKSKDINFVVIIKPDLIAYATDWEIYLLDTTLNKNELITRISKKITSLSWRENNYIIYSTENSINIIDLANKESSKTLISLEKTSNAIINQKGNILYFTAKIGNQEGLYKMFIK